MSTINIVASCDEKFAQHLSVMLVSLMENNPSEAFEVFLLTTASPATRDRIVESCAGYRCRIVPLKIDTRPLNGVPVTGHITRAAYYRLLLGELLPPEITRVLYLDSDIVIAGSIGALWNADLGTNVIGAVADDSDQSGCLRKLGMTSTDGYFNSGVMLADLARWRAEKVGEAAIAFARNESHRITWWDQCALNFVLRGRWRRLDRKWNTQTMSVCVLSSDRVVPSTEGLRRLRDAAVIHFTTASKPWQYLCEHPSKSRYWHYLRKTPWRDYRPPDRSVHNFIRKNLPWLLPAYVRLRHHIRPEGGG